MSFTIAVITPTQKEDYLANTILDGLIALRDQGRLRFFVSSCPSGPHDVSEYMPNEDEFVSRAREADIILFIWGKKKTDFELAKRIDAWHKTVYIDGSELGLNRRFDVAIQAQVLKGTYNEQGDINRDMLERCAGYFRREPPYVSGIVPLPFGIESRYIRYTRDTKKDIDFFCVFGQDKYPPLRRAVREELEQYCAEHNLICRTERTAMQDEFYDLLARSKVGISVGGGGFDTARFWEILGNNCMLMTERIDIFEPGSDAFAYDRIVEFDSLYDFRVELERIHLFLRRGYNIDGLNNEYHAILQRHSASARVETILEHARAKGIVRG